MSKRKEVKEQWSLLKRLVVEEEGQGLVEYSLIVLLVALVFWMAVQGSGVDQALTNTWRALLTVSTLVLVLLVAEASQHVCLYGGLGARNGRFLPPKPEAIW